MATLRNNGEAKLTIDDLPGQQTGQGTIIYPGQTIRVFNDDLSRSLKITQLVNSGTITVVDFLEPVGSLMLPIDSQAILDSIAAVDARVGTVIQGRPILASAPTTGQSLTWNGTDWAPGGGGGGGTVFGGGVAGQIAFWTDVVTISADPGLAWDNIGKLLTVAHLSSTAEVSAGTMFKVAGVQIASANLSDFAALIKTSTALGGDLSGFLPNGVVARVNGVAVTGVAVAGKVLTATSPSAASWQTAPGTPPDASTSVKGIVLMSIAPVLATSPIAVGDNDPRMTNVRAPSGAASGDLGGFFPGPTVTHIQGIPVAALPASINQALLFDGVNWAPTTITFGDITGSGSTGQIAFWTSSSIQTADPNLYWDNVGKKFGLGTTTPMYRADVVGDVNVSGLYRVGGVQIASSNLLDVASLIKSSTVLSGDLSGSLPGPTVVALRGVVISATAPTVAGQTLRYNGTQWVAALLASTDLSDTTSIFYASGSNPLTGNLSAGGNKLTNLGAPTSAQDAATKAYVDATAQGLSVKQSVRALAAVPITLSGPQTIDDVILVAGNRVLVTAQGSAIANGIYVVAAGAWARGTDMASGSQAAGTFTFVEEGTTHGSSGWVCNDPEAADTVGTDPLGFTQFSGAGDITAGTGLTKVGNTLSLTAPVTVPLGGTGQTTLTLNGVLVGNGASAVTSVTAGSAGLPLLSTGGAPAFGALNLAGAGTVSGQLGVGFGGTGASVLAGNGALVMNGSGTIVTSVVSVTVGQVLRNNGTTWVAAALASTDLSDTANLIRTSTTLGGDLSGTLPNPTVAKVNGIIVTGTPTAGQVLTASSGVAAAWATPTPAIPGGGSGAVQFNNAGSFGGDFANFSWDTVNKRLTVGGTSTSTFLKLEAQMVAGQPCYIGSVSYSNGAPGATSGFIGVHAGGSQALPMAVPDGDFLLRLGVVGYDGSTFDFSNFYGLLQFRARGGWGPTAHGTDMAVILTPSGSNTIGVPLFLTATGGLRAGFGGNVAPLYTVDAVGDANVTGVYRVGGVQLASSNLSDSASLIKTSTALGGDLSGFLPNATVAALRGTGVSATAPTTGQVLAFNGSVWAPSAAGTGTISGSGAATQLAFFTSANAIASDAQMTYDSTNKYLGLGKAAAAPAATLDAATDSGSAIATVRLTLYSNTANLAALQQRRARGTSASPTGLLSGDLIAVLGGIGYGATAFASGGRAATQNVAAENWSDVAQGARIQFFTTPNGTTATAEVGRFSPGGNFGVGTTTPGFKIDAAGDINTSGVYRVGGAQMLSGASGKIAYFTGAQTQVSSANLSWDNVNNILYTGSFELTGAPNSIQNNVDGGAGGFLSVCYSNSQHPAFAGLKAGGTLALPLATGSGSKLVEFTAIGHDGTNFDFGNYGGSMQYNATETWSLTGHGTSWSLKLVPATTLSAITVIYAVGDNGGQIFVGRPNPPTNAVDGPYSLEVGENGLAIVSSSGAALIRSIGYSSFTGILGYSAQGTEATPTATLAGDDLMFIGGKGYDGTQFSAGGSVAKIHLQAVETFSPTAQGTVMKFQVTQATTTTLKNALYLSAISTGAVRVGIATFSPAFTLDVNGDANVVGAYRVGGIVKLDANGAYALKDAGGSVDVSAATAPTTGQVLTATSPTTATWQSPTGGPATALDTTGSPVNVSSAAPPTTGQVLTATSPTTATWQTPTGASSPTTEFPFVSQTTVVVTHSLGWRPIVQVVDATGLMVIPNSVQHNSTSQFTVTFSPAFTGTVIYR